MRPNCDLVAIRSQLIFKHLSGRFSNYFKETENTVLEKMLGWPKTVFDCFTALADALVGAFELNNLKDMDIYAKIQEQDYRTVFDRYGSELTIQEIISKCTNV